MGCVLPARWVEANSQGVYSSVLAATTTLAVASTPELLGNFKLMAMGVWPDKSQSN
jgi:hypothetical protein